MPVLTLLHNSTWDSTIPGAVEIGIVIPGAAIGDVVFVETYSGMSVSDSKGNSYSLALSAGSMRVFVSTLATALVSGVDSITVVGSAGWGAFKALAGTLDTPHIGKSASGSGTITTHHDDAVNTHRDLGVFTILQDPEDYVAAFVTTRAIGGATWNAPFGNADIRGMFSSNPPSRGGTDTSFIEGWAFYQGQDNDGVGYTGGTGTSGGHWHEEIDLINSGWPFPSGPDTIDVTWEFLAYQILGLGAVVPPESSGIANDGTDLVISSVGLHRAYREIADIRFQTLRWGAADWDAAVTIASDADSTVAQGTAPALAINEHEDIYCWYHTTAPALKGYRSEDWGQTWGSSYTSHAGYRNPRIAFVRERFLVALFNGDLLDVFESSDGGVALDLAVTFATQPKQRPNLQVDHQEIVHLVWEDADGNTIHRGSKAPGQLGSWSDPVALVSGHVPGYAVGHRRAAICSFDEAGPPADLNFGLTDSTYGAPDSDDAMNTPAASFEKAYVGLAWDVRDHLWLCARAFSTGHAMLLWKTEDDLNWLLFGGGGGLGP